MHGAAHQTPQVFQVMVDRHVADRDIERVRLRFYANEHLGKMATEERRVDTGRMHLATGKTTLVDLVVHPDDADPCMALASHIWWQKRVPDHLRFAELGTYFGTRVAGAQPPSFSMERTWPRWESRHEP